MKTVVKHIFIVGFLVLHGVFNSASDLLPKDDSWWPNAHDGLMFISTMFAMMAGGLIGFPNKVEIHAPPE